MQIAKRPNRITQREAAAAWNVGAPLDMELKTVKPKRQVNRNSEKEWKIQAKSIKALRARMLVDKNLCYEVNLIEGARTGARAAMMKLMGGFAGPNDLTLYRRYRGGVVGQESRAPSVKILRIEFKIPGGKLTDPQLGWFGWWRAAGVRCERVDNLEDFLKLLDGF